MKKKRTKKLNVPVVPHTLSPTENDIAVRHSFLAAFAAFCCIFLHVKVKVRCLFYRWEVTVQCIPPGRRKIGLSLALLLQCIPRREKKDERWKMIER